MAFQLGKRARGGQSTQETESERSHYRCLQLAFPVGVRYERKSGGNKDQLERSQMDAGVVADLGERSLPSKSRQ